MRTRGRRFVCARCAVVAVWWRRRMHVRTGAVVSVRRWRCVNVRRVKMLWWRRGRGHARSNGCTPQRLRLGFVPQCRLRQIALPQESARHTWAPLCHNSHFTRYNVTHKYANHSATPHVHTFDSRGSSAAVAAPEVASKSRGKAQWQHLACSIGFVTERRLRQIALARSVGLGLQQRCTAPPCASHALAPQHNAHLHRLVCAHASSKARETPRRADASARQLATSMPLPWHARVHT